MKKCNKHTLSFSLDGELDRESTLTNSVLFESTHGLSKHRLYYTWKGMRARCYSLKHKAYKNYGGRGITVCDEWRDSPTQFIEDMFPSFEEGLSLDRIDNNKSYSKDNCRWATIIEQNNNKRISHVNKTGFIGVSYEKYKDKFVVYITIKNKQKFIGLYPSSIDAAIARNNYILSKGLPNKLNIITTTNRGGNIFVNGCISGSNEYGFNGDYLPLQPYQWIGIWNNEGYAEEQKCVRIR